MNAKQKHTEDILLFLSNPDNEIISKADLARDVLGLKNSQQLYEYFDPDEIDELYLKALDIRRKRYACGLMKADKALLNRADAGDVQAIKLAYQRFEGWSEKNITDLNVDGVENIKVTFE